MLERDHHENQQFFSMLGEAHTIINNTSVCRNENQYHISMVE